MERNPHLLIEGCAIGCYAIGSSVAYIYIRGEFLHVQTVLEAAIAEAYRAGYLGKNILGTGFNCDVFMHRGAGAYEAGEETALIESLEGKRAQPRLKPPFPAVVGLYGCPTAVNNVETLCNVPSIIVNGPEWYAGLGPEKNGGPKLFCVSGHVVKPGVYEGTMTTTIRELIYDYGGGIPNGRQLKAVIPGGSSVPVLRPDEIDVQASFDALMKAGSMLGSAGSDRDGRHDMHGVGVPQPAALLSPRVVRQVHAVPRGRRLAVQAAVEGRDGRRPPERPRPADERGEQHRRQDALPVR